MPQNNQQVISKELSEAYDLAMNEVALSHKERATAAEKYWWNLWVIKRDELWKAKFELFEGWIGEFSTEPFGESRATYYNVMGAIERMFRAKVTEKTVKLYLGNRGVALESDMKEWFDNNGKGELLPEVVKQLEDGGENLNQFVRRVVDLPSGERRKEVTRFTQKDKIYPTDEQALWDDETGTLLFNVNWENEGGLMGKFTLTLTGLKLLGNGKSKVGSVLPSKVAEWAMSKLGVRS